MGATRHAGCHGAVALTYRLSDVRVSLRAKHAATTSGQWYSANTAGQYGTVRSAQGPRSVYVGQFHAQADRDFITYAHEYVPVLLGALDTAELVLRSRYDRVRALEDELLDLTRHTAEFKNEIRMLAEENYILRGQLAQAGVPAEV